MEIICIQRSDILHPIYRRGLPQTHGERGGEAGEKSPNEPSYYEEDITWDTSESTAPRSFKAFVTLTIILVFVLIFFGNLILAALLGYVYPPEMGIAFLVGFGLLIISDVVSLIVFIYTLKRTHTTFSEFCHMAKNRVYDPE